MSDISFELNKEAIDLKLPPISEVEDAKCECCGMSEECTPEYIGRVRERFSGKWICGLCAEAVKEEVEKNGGKRGLEDALVAHMSACVRFNKLGKAYPVLCQAEAMRKLLKKSASEGRHGSTYTSPRNSSSGRAPGSGGLTRSSSCIPAITREISDLHIHPSE